MQTNELKGIFNLITISSDFDKDYVKTKVKNIFVDESLSEKMNSGVIIEAEDLKHRKYMKISIPNYIFSMVEDFYGIPNEDPDEPSSYKIDDGSYLLQTLISVCGFYGIEIVMGCCEHIDEKSGVSENSIIFKKDNDFFSSQIELSYLVCACTLYDIPFYVRKECFEKFGNEFNDLSIGG